MKPRISILFHLAFLAIFISCNRGPSATNDTSDASKITYKDTSSVIAIKKSVPEVRPQYVMQVMDSVLISRLKTMDPNQLHLIYVLNRTDSRYLNRQDSVLLPDTFLTDINKYCPFPLKDDSLTSIQKIIIISYELQLFAAYENGVLVRFGPVSMGKRSTPTPTGLFHTNWKAKRTISTIDEEWIMNWYFNLDNFQGVSMHEYDLPGYPASHACIRMLQEDAKWNYYWSQQWILENDVTIAAYGTPVIIYGEYPFGKRRPWRNLTVNPDTLHITNEELYDIYGEYISLIHSRQTQRDSLATPAVL